MRPPKGMSLILWAHKEQPGCLSETKQDHDLGQKNLVPDVWAIQPTLELGMVEVIFLTSYKSGILINKTHWGSAFFGLLFLSFGHNVKTRCYLFKLLKI